MNTQISTKVVALAVALLMNAMLLGSVAYLFNGRSQPASLTAVAQRGIALVERATF